MTVADLLADAKEAALRAVLKEASRSAGVPVDGLEVVGVTFAPGGPPPLWAVRVRASQEVVGRWEYGFLDPLRPTHFVARRAV